MFGTSIVALPKLAAIQMIWEDMESRTWAAFTWTLFLMKRMFPHYVIVTTIMIIPLFNKIYHLEVENCIQM